MRAFLPIFSIIIFTVVVRCSSQSKLTERDSTKIALPYSADGAAVPVQKFRDVHGGRCD